MTQRGSHPGGSTEPERRVTSFRRGDLSFDVADRGPIAGPVAVLLHGWPGGARTWDEVVPRLGERGVRTLAPDQRGYSPGARPKGRRNYVMDELVSDVVALIDEAKVPRVHLVGHDWGGAVAWVIASRFAQRVASLTVLSTPHPAALASSVWSSDQALRSSYMAGFQVPVIAERVLLARDAALLRVMLERSGLGHERAIEYSRRQQEPGMLSGGLAWYRALPLERGTGAGEVTVPTTFAWSTGDVALGRRAAELTADHVTGPYRFEVLEGVSHWIPEQEPATTTDLILDRIAGFAEPDGS